MWQGIQRGLQLLRTQRFACASAMAMGADWEGVVLAEWMAKAAATEAGVRALAEAGSEAEVAKARAVMEVVASGRKVAAARAPEGSAMEEAAVKVRVQFPKTGAVPPRLSAAFACDPFHAAVARAAAVATEVVARRSSFAPVQANSSPTAALEAQICHQPSTWN